MQIVSKLYWQNHKTQKRWSSYTCRQQTKRQQQFSCFTLNINVCWIRSRTEDPFSWNTVSLLKNIVIHLSTQKKTTTMEIKKIKTFHYHTSLWSSKHVNSKSKFITFNCLAAFLGWCWKYLQGHWMHHRNKLFPITIQEFRSQETTSTTSLKEWDVWSNTVSCHTVGVCLCVWGRVWEKNNVPLFHGPHRPPGSITGPSSRAFQHRRGEGPAETRVAMATLTYAEGKHTDYILAFVTAAHHQGALVWFIHVGVDQK